MDFIENLLSHMSSTFNRESILPKQEEIAEDETFKWRALKNNQFASRSKNSQPKHSNINISSAPFAEDISASNTNFERSEVVIEIANGISNAEIKEALITQQSASAENGESSHQNYTYGKSETEIYRTINLHDGDKFETVSTSNLFKHMSSTFNATGEVHTKNIKRIKSYEKSNKFNVCTVRRSNRLRQDSLKNECTDYQEQSIIECPGTAVNNLKLSRNSEFLHKTVTSLIVPKHDAVNQITLECKNINLDDGKSAPAECANKKKYSSYQTISKQKTILNMSVKKLAASNNGIEEYFNLKGKHTASHKQNNRKLKSLLNKKSVRHNDAETLNVYSNIENTCRLRGRLSRPIKLSAKILANKKLRHGFELQNSARLRCNSKIKPSKASPDSEKLPGTEQQTFFSNSKSKTDNPDSQQFLGQIKRTNLPNNKSPETNRNQNKSQLQQLNKLKERYFRTLGLLSINSSKQTSKSKEHMELKFTFEPNESICPDAKVASANNDKKKRSMIPGRSIPSLKTRAFETCCCEKSFPYFTARVQSRILCTAIDEVHGKLIKCGNKLEGKAQNFLRPSLRSSYQLLCKLHYKRFRRHCCCAQCGIYCTQGEFSICSRSHLFHTKCAETYGIGLRQKDITTLLLNCPHCGVKENSEKLTKIQIMID
uniref:Histone-lysine N-methyltransferase EHMT2 n=2 Tax=Culex pipiens TaxID=7175 RepID=A0A8D8J6S0_CULPI